MKVFRKMKNLEKEVDKIKSIPEKEEMEEKNGKVDSQRDTTGAKKQKKNCFLAGLRRAWRAITRSVRGKTSSPGRGHSEKVPAPSGISSADNKGLVAAKSCIVKDLPKDNSGLLETTGPKMDKIKSIPEEEEIEQRNGKSDGQKTSRAKKQKMKSFSACLRRAWRAITGRMRGGKSSPEKGNSEEVPAPSGITMAGNKAHGLTSSISTSENEEDSGLVESSNRFASRFLQTSEELSTESESSTEESSLGEDETSSAEDTPEEDSQSYRCDTEACSTSQISEKSFTFFQMLGTGAFGYVFLARENFSKEYVAVKAVGKSNLTKRRYNSFVVERNVLQLSSQSPHLIHGLAAFQTKNYIYFVMELACAGDLFDVIHERYPFDAASLQFMTASLICGVQFLHKNGIIHRDLKPQNILVTTEGRLKITDFGLAITGVYDTTEDNCGGTPGYAAPEMVNNQIYGPGVDYFSVGATFYYLSTKSDAFPGNDMVDYKHYLNVHKPDYPIFLTPDTVALLEQLLCIDPTKRLGVNGAIKKHPFFSGVNWEDIEAGITEPPASLSVIPTELDVSEPMDFYYDEEDVGDQAEDISKNFSFVCPKWSNHYPTPVKKTK